MAEAPGSPQGLLEICLMSYSQMRSEKSILWGSAREMSEREQELLVIYFLSGGER